MFDSIFRSLTVLWFRGSNVQCNCCSRKFRSFVFKSDANGHHLFLCPSCRSTAEDRLLCYFLQTDTSFYSKGSKNILYARRNIFGHQSQTPNLSIKNADFIVCNDLQLCPKAAIQEFMSEARAGAYFIFASQSSDPLLIKKELSGLFPAATLTRLDFSGDIRMADRAFWGLVSDMPIYVVSKSWRLGS